MSNGDGTSFLGTIQNNTAYTMNLQQITNTLGSWQQGSAPPDIIGPKESVGLAASNDTGPTQAYIAYTVKEAEALVNLYFVIAPCPTMTDCDVSCVAGDIPVFCDDSASTCGKGQPIYYIGTLNAPE